MDKHKARKIRMVARRVRKELEGFVKGEHTTFNFAAPHLGGLCGYGSVMLHQALTDFGFHPEIISGVGHWFVRCEGFLVDVTASQFGQGKIVVRDYECIAKGIEKNEYYMGFWSLQQSYKTVDECLGNLAMTIQHARSLKKK